MVAYLHHTNVGYKLCGRCWLTIIGPIYEVNEAILHLFSLHKSRIGTMQEFRHLPLSDIAAIYPSSAAIRPTVYGLLGIYVSEKFKSSALNHLTTITDDNETCAVRISVSPRVSLDIIGLYRPPRGNPIEFNNKLHQMIFDNNSTKTIILGDLNLNLLNLNDSHTVDLLNNMQSLSYRPLINKPTRSTMNSATCIDHIWTNNSSNHISGVFEDIQITDHNPIFASVKLNLSNLVEHKTFRNNSLQNLARLDYEMSLFTNRFYSQFNNNSVNE